MPDRSPAIRTLIAIGTLSLTPMLTAHADSALQLRVLDRDGLPVPEVAVYARSLNAAAAGNDPSKAGIGPGGRAGAAAVVSTASMNQHELAFEPHILIVATGTAIDFSNSDDVRHHVYSFSEARAFDFSINSGSVHESLRFDVPGLVTLGCNVHDKMLGFILIVDTPHFAKTNGEGIVEFQGLAPGSYEFALWTPRLAAKHLPAPSRVDLGADATVVREHRFEQKLYPPHRHSETSLHWSHY